MKEDFREKTIKTYNDIKKYEKHTMHHEKFLNLEELRQPIVHLRKGNAFINFIYNDDQVEFARIIKEKYQKHTFVPYDPLAVAAKKNQTLIFIKNFPDDWNEDNLVQLLLPFAKVETELVP